MNLDRFKSLINGVKYQLNAILGEINHQVDVKRFLKPATKLMKLTF
jgi:hypothetical protein